MNTKKFWSMIFIALTVISPLNCLHTNIYASDERPSEVFFAVTLKPGNGSGQDILIKNTDPGAMTPVGSQSINKGQFALLDGTFVYRLPDIPEQFSAPNNQPNNAFLGWEPVDNEGIYPPGTLWQWGNSSTTSISFNAIWGDSYYKLKSQNLIDIINSGATNITSQLTDLKLGKFYNSNRNEVPAQLLYFNYFNGTLKCGNKSIPYTVRSTFEHPSLIEEEPVSDSRQPSENTNNSIAITQPFSSAGTNVRMEIYVSPEDYQNAEPGTYTGNLKYTGMYAYTGPRGSSSLSPFLEESNGGSGYIPLRLIVPSNKYTVTLPSTDPRYSISYNGNTTVNSGGDFTFKVNIARGYKRENNFAVKSNGIQLEETNGIYTIPNIQENQFVTIEGIAKLSYSNSSKFFKTGDDTSIVSLIVIAAVSFLGIGMVLFIEKKRKIKKQ